MLLPSNIQPDKYLGKGYWFLGIFIFVLLIFFAFGIFIILNFDSDKLNRTLFNGAISFTVGAIGGIVSIILALFTFLAFYVQYDANKKIQEQFNSQTANEHFYKMLELHKENINEFRIKSHTSLVAITKETHSHGNLDATIKTVETESFQPSEYYSYGRRCFILMLNDIHYCIQTSLDKAQEFNLILDTETILQLAYRVFFWGSHSKHVYPPDLSVIQIQECKRIVFELDKLRREQRNSDSKVRKFSYFTNDNEGNHVHARFILLSGHSSRLAHYYRQLYQTAKHIHNTSSFQDDEFLKNSDIDLRFKTLRAQMTNEEQLLLYYNYRYGFGGRWDYRYDDPTQGTSEFRFFTKYLMLHNVPLYDTMHAKAENPIEHFQAYKDKYPEADLFEWGGYN